MDDIFFSTAHKARGLESEQLWLADDYMHFLESGRELGPDQVGQEEVDILNGALTRVCAAVRLSESLAQWLRHRRRPPT